MLHVEHLLHLHVVEPVRPPPGPAGHACGDLESLLVPAKAVHVGQAGIDLVERVPWGPDLPPCLHTIEEFLGKGTEIAAAANRLLAPGQFGHNPVGLGPDGLVPGACVHQRARRQVMSDRVSPQFDVGLLPPTVGLRRRRQARRHPEHMEKPVRVQAVDVLPVPFHRLPERPVEQAHLPQIEGMSPDRDRRPDLFRGPDCRSGKGDEAECSDCPSTAMSNHGNLLADVRSLRQSRGVDL
jgi:hypothetical protein